MHGFAHLITALIRLKTSLNRNKDLGGGGGDYIIFRVKGVFRNNPYAPIANSRGRVGENVFGGIGNPWG